jgi:transposase
VQCDTNSGSAGTSAVRRQRGARCGALPGVCSGGKCGPSNILYRLKTGCQWKALPNEFGSGSTCHLRFHQWCEAGVFQQLHAELLRYYDKKRGIQWQWAALDTAMVKAPKGGTSRAATRPTAARAE